MTRKNHEEAKQDKLAVALLVEVYRPGHAFDRVILHALRPDIKYGTISRMIVQLEEKGLIQVVVGANEWDAGDLRRALNLGSHWNPVAESGHQILNGTTSPKAYRRTNSWSFSEACKVLGVFEDLHD